MTFKQHFFFSHNKFPYVYGLDTNSFFSFISLYNTFWE